jgi:hypothetical protein
MLLAHAVRFRAAFAASYRACSRGSVVVAAVRPFGEHGSNSVGIGSSPRHRLVALCDIAGLVCQGQVLGVVGSTTRDGQNVIDLGG